VSTVNVVSWGAYPDTGCELGGPSCLTCVVPGDCAKTSEGRQGQCRIEVYARYRRIVRLRQRGLTLSQIGAQLDVTQRTVCRAIAAFRRGEFSLDVDEPTVDSDDMRPRRSFFRPFAPPRLLAPGAGTG